MFDFALSDPGLSPTFSPFAPFTPFGALDLLPCSRIMSDDEERPRKVRRRLCVKEKAEILQWMDTHKKTLEETCKEFQLSVSTLAKWRMKKDEIIAQASQPHQANLKAHHAPKFPELEEKVLAWIDDDEHPSKSTVEEYFHQARSEFLSQYHSNNNSGEEHNMTDEEAQKKSRIEKMIFSSEFVHRFMIRNGIAEISQTQHRTPSSAIKSIGHHNHSNSNAFISPLSIATSSSSNSNAPSSWETRLDAIEQNWGLHPSPTGTNRKERIEAVERQVFGGIQTGTLMQRIQALE